MKRNCQDLVVFSRQQPEVSIEQTALEKCVKGRPEQRSWNHFSSADDRFFCGIWEADPGCWRIDYTENEYCRILAGHSILRDADGAEVHVNAGDDLVIPAGFNGQWEVLETTRKVYVIYQP